MGTESIQSAKGNVLKKTLSSGGLRNLSIDSSSSASKHHHLQTHQQPRQQLLALQVNSFRKHKSVVQSFDFIARNDKINHSDYRLVSWGKDKWLHSFTFTSDEMATCGVSQYKSSSLSSADSFTDETSKGARSKNDNVPISSSPVMDSPLSIHNRSTLESSPSTIAEEYKNLLETIPSIIGEKVIVWFLFFFLLLQYIIICFDLLMLTDSPLYSTTSRTDDW